MTKAIRIVAPFRPFPPESELHREMAAFDWIEALRMMVHSATLACHCPVHAITDVDTDLPVPTLKYPTVHRRLMLWTLEACLAYLDSTDFDRDTVMLDVDQLVFADLAPYFKKNVDLGIVIRSSEKHTTSADGQPLLNGVQFWRHKSRNALVKFYRRALELAGTLPEERIVWGADTDALRMLLEPFCVHAKDRSGVTVNMMDADSVIETFSTSHTEAMAAGRMPWPKLPVLDFRWTRKPFLPVVYRATIMHGAVA